MEATLHNSTGYQLSHNLQRNLRWLQYLHLPGFSQNPVSMLHSALHSQPLRQIERDSVFASKVKNTKPQLNIYSNKIFIRNTFSFYRDSVKNRLYWSQISLSDDPPGLMKISNYLWRRLSRLELRPPLQDASQFVKNNPSLCWKNREDKRSLCAVKARRLYI